MAETLYCANHPGRETLLRCNKCGKPICPECSVRHPVGLRCQECAQLRRLPIYEVAPRHYVLGLTAGLAAAMLAGLAFTLVRGIVFGFFFGFFLLLLAGPAAGGFVAQAMNRATGYRKGTGLAVMAALAIALGYLLGTGLLVLVVGWLEFGTLVIPSLHIFADPLALLYLLLAGGSAAALLRR